MTKRMLPQDGKVGGPGREGSLGPGELSEIGLEPCMAYGWEAPLTGLGGVACPL